jgi:hypothetical protein
MQAVLMFGCSGEAFETFAQAPSIILTPLLVA